MSQLGHTGGKKVISAMNFNGIRQVFLPSQVCPRIPAGHYFSNREKIRVWFFRIVSWFFRRVSNFSWFLVITS